MPTPLVAEFDDALSLWHEVCDFLDDLGSLHRADVYTIELFVLNTIQLRKVQRDLMRYGHIDLFDSGSSRPSGNSTVAEKLVATQTKLLRELELTVASRPEVIEMGEEESFANRLASILSGGQN